MSQQLNRSLRPRHVAMNSIGGIIGAGLESWAGFICGWLYWCFWIIVVSVEAIVGADIRRQWLPLPPWQLGLGLMGVMTAGNLMSARSYGAVTPGQQRDLYFSLITLGVVVLAFAALRRRRVGQPATALP